MCVELPEEAAQRCSTLLLARANFRGYARGLGHKVGVLCIRPRMRLREELARRMQLALQTERLRLAEYRLLVRRLERKRLLRRLHCAVVPRDA